LKHIQIEEVDPAREVHYQFKPPKLEFSTKPTVDLGALGLAIHNILKDSVTGYILQIRSHGQLVHVGIWNWAQTPVDANTGWTENTSMHVASVSKFLTAVGMVKTLDTEGISYDAKIIDYLPVDWSKGKNVDKITFGHLFTHRSGFSTGSSASDYAFMKAKVAAGAAKVGGYDYENMNFGLCRILLPIINGNIKRDAKFIEGPLNDLAWDAVTLYHFRNYMQAKVFSPAGVQNVGFAPKTTNNALAYQHPHANKQGWNSGDLASVAGGAGFRLSTRELLNVMDHVRRRNTILPAEKAQYMLDNSFGIDQVIDTAAGKLYNKNGAWGSKAVGTQQCVAYFLPNSMELVVFVNSPIGVEGFSLRGIVKDVFVNSLSA
jgi:CubicO group peptidase (beta-lactamase class C family)